MTFSILLAKRVLLENKVLYRQGAIISCTISQVTQGAISGCQFQSNKAPLGPAIYSRLSRDNIASSNKGLSSSDVTLSNS